MDVPGGGIAFAQVSAYEGNIGDIGDIGDIGGEDFVVED